MGNKDFKGGKNQWTTNGESIGVGNQGETLARMEVELWARLSACFWAYKTHAKPETQMEAPSKYWASLGQLAQTFTLEALGFNCDTGAPGLHVFRCLLRLATLSEHFPRIGTGINVWEKIDRETQGSWAPTGLAVGNSPLVLRAFFAREKSVPATTFCSNSSIDFSGRICGC